MENEKDNTFAFAQI